MRPAWNSLSWPQCCSLLIGTNSCSERCSPTFHIFLILKWDDCRGSKAKREQWDLRQPRLSPEQLCMCDFFVIWQLVSLPYGRTDIRQLGTSGLNTDYFLFFLWRKHSTALHFILKINSHTLVYINTYDSLNLQSLKILGKQLVKEA